MTKHNINFISHFKVLAFGLFTALLITPNINYAQSDNGRRASKPSQLVAPVPASAPNRVQNIAADSATVSSENVRSNAGFIAPSAAPERNTDRSMPIQPQEMDLFGSSVPQSYNDWLEHYKLKYAHLTCPSQKCILLGNVGVNKAGATYTINLSGYSYSNNQKLRLPAAYDEKARKIWPSQVQITNANKVVNPVAYSENLDSSIIVNKGDWSISQTFDANTLSFIDTKGAYVIFSNKTGESIDYNSSEQKLSFNKSIAEPVLTGNVGSKNETQLSAKVYRLYSEVRPAQLQTQLQITYFGPSQEVKLGKIIPDDFIMSSYSSAVPLRFDNQSKEYYAFLNPGNWTIYLNAHTNKPTDSVNVSDLVAINTSKSEIWSISSQPNIRQFEVLSGNQKSAISVDPKIAYVPAQWGQFNAYKVDGAIVFKTVNKVLTEDVNSLKTMVLNRVTWIGLDDKAIHKEEIVITNDKNIDVATLNPSVVVETALAQEKPQLIFKDKDRSAISIAPGSNHYKLLTSTSNTIPLSSIENSQVNKINSWEINLAPRTRLFSYSGADYIAGSWVNNWNLYAVFGLFLITLSFYKLFGWPASLICFIGIAVNVHNSFMAWTVWPAILICMALIKVLSREKEKAMSSPILPIPDTQGQNEQGNIKNNTSENEASENIKAGAASHKLQTFLRFALFGLLISMGAYSTFLTINEARSIINPSLEGKGFYVGENARGYGADTDYNNANRQTRVMNSASPAAASAGRMSGMDISSPSESNFNSVQIMEKAQLEQDKQMLEINASQASQSKNQVSSGTPQWFGNTHRVTVSNFSSKDVLSLYIAPVWLVNIMGIVQVFVAWLICAFMLSFILLNNLFTFPKTINLDKYFVYSKYAKKVWPKK